MNFFDQIIAAGRAAGGGGRARGFESPNYDPSNKLWAEDVLYLCYEIHRGDSLNGRESDLLQILAEQLHDMSTGACPPGRTTRLFQVVVSMK